MRVYNDVDGLEKLYYLHTDNLGSIQAITDENKAIVSSYYYTPWGGRILLSGANITDRGYTFHEHLEPFGLINMNGRVCDPVLARFLSPDNYVQAPDYTQNFNRYAYCLNNPFKYTDPGGDFIFSILCAIIPGAQVLLPYAIYADAACWGAAFNVAANWKDIKANGGFGSGKFWSYAGLGATNGLGVASGNFWVMGVAGALQSGGNAFVGNDFKYTDKIWSEAAWGGATSLAFGYLTGPANKGSFLKGTKGLDLDGGLSKFIQKSGLSKATSNLLGRAVVDFGFNYSTGAVYNKYISDDPHLNENWSSEALKSATLSTVIDFGFNYVETNSSELIRYKVDQKQKLDNDLKMYEYRQNKLPMPIEHTIFYQPKTPIINPGNTYIPSDFHYYVPELKIDKTR